MTCASCKLSFDPRSEPVARPTRRAKERELVAPPRGISIERTRDLVTIRWGFERLRGVGALALGMVCAAVLIGNLNTPGEEVSQLLLLGVAAAVMLALGALLALTDRVLRVDAWRLTVRREPFGVGRSIGLARADIDAIGVAEAVRGWQVIARGKQSTAVVAAMPTKEAADCVAEVVREALDAIKKA